MRATEASNTAITTAQMLDDTAVAAEGGGMGVGVGAGATGAVEPPKATEEAAAPTLAWSCWFRVPLAAAPTTALAAAAALGLAEDPMTWLETVKPARLRVLVMTTFTTWEASMLEAAATAAAKLVLKAGTSAAAGGLAEKVKVMTADKSEAKNMPHMFMGMLAPPH